MMKLLKDVDAKIAHPEPSEDPVEAKAQQESMTSYRKLLRVLAFNISPHSLEQSDHLRQIRMKLACVDPDVLLEEPEFRVLTDQIYPNKLSWSAYMHSEMVEYMREADKRKIELKVKEN